MLPGTIAQMMANVHKYAHAHWLDYLRMLSPGTNSNIFVKAIHFGTSTINVPVGAIVGGLIYFLLVVFFTYFYTAVVYNVQDISDNLKKNGSFIPGLRPGKQTEKYIDMVLTRITFAGALFLGIVALLPYVIPAILSNTAAGVSANSFTLWGGTSLLIVVGVALDTIRQLEAHMVMRHYEGFIK
jgi:preprotein translocase subunit SecY